MAIGNALGVPRFPTSLQKAQVPGGQFSGLLQGLETMVTQRTAKRKEAREETKVQSQNLKTLITAYNSELNRISNENRELIKIEGNRATLRPVPSFNDFVKRFGGVEGVDTGDRPDGGVGVGLGGRAPAGPGGRIETRGLSTGQKFLGGALRGITNVAGAGGRLLGGAGGEQKTREVIGELIANIPGLRNALKPRGEVIDTTGQAGAGREGLAEDRTDEILEIIDTAQNADEAIQFLKDTDDDFDMQFTTTGKRLEDVVNLQEIIDRLIEKFGPGIEEKLRNQLGT